MHLLMHCFNYGDNNEEIILKNIGIDLVNVLVYGLSTGISVFL